MRVSAAAPRYLRDSGTHDTDGPAEPGLPHPPVSLPDERDRLTAAARPARRRRDGTAAVASTNHQVGVGP
jgi:hypothetical protein